MIIIGKDMDGTIDIFIQTNALRIVRYLCKPTLSSELYTGTK